MPQDTNQKRPSASQRRREKQKRDLAQTRWRGAETEARDEARDAEQSASASRSEQSKSKSQSASASAGGSIRSSAHEERRPASPPPATVDPSRADTVTPNDGRTFSGTKTWGLIVRHPESGCFLAVDYGTTVHGNGVAFAPRKPNEASLTLMRGNVPLGFTFRDVATRECHQLTNVEVTVKGVVQIDHTLVGGGTSFKMHVLFYAEPTEAAMDKMSNYRGKDGRRSWGSGRGQLRDLQWAEPSALVSNKGNRFSAELRKGASQVWEGRVADNDILKDSVMAEEKTKPWWA